MSLQRNIFIPREQASTAPALTGMNFDMSASINGRDVAVHRRDQTAFV